jgi:hypothetical protein
MPCSSSDLRDARAHSPASDQGYWRLWRNGWHVSISKSSREVGDGMRAWKNMTISLLSLRVWVVLLFSPRRSGRSLIVPQYLHSFHKTVKGFADCL